MPVDKEKVNRFKYWMIGMVNGIEPRDLVAMIKNNDVPLPFDLELPIYFDWVRDAVIEYKEAILEQLTFESAMKYSGEFRPDLKIILQHARGREWLERFLKVIRFMIANIELTPYEMKVKFFTRVQKIQQERQAVIDIEKGEQAEMAAHLEKEKIKELEKLQLDTINNIAEEKKGSIPKEIPNKNIIVNRSEEKRKSLYDNSPYDIY